MARSPLRNAGASTTEAPKKEISSKAGLYINNRRATIHLVDGRRVASGEQVELTEEEVLLYERFLTKV